MKKKIRYPMLAAAIAASMASAGAGAAAPTAAPMRTGTSAAHLSEAQKIEVLIHSVEMLKGAVFIRNGTEYDGAKAAEHLRRKLDYAGNKIKTAEQFIDQLATGSSMSGKPYKIRYANGITVDSAVYFHEQLRKLEAPTLSTKG